MDIDACCTDLSCAGPATFDSVACPADFAEAFAAGSATAAAVLLFAAFFAERPQALCFCQSVFASCRFGWLAQAPSCKFRLHENRLQDRPPPIF